MEESRFLPYEIVDNLGEFPVGGCVAAGTTGQRGSIRVGSFEITHALEVEVNFVRSFHFGKNFLSQVETLWVLDIEDATRTNSLRELRKSWLPVNSISP